MHIPEHDSFAAALKKRKRELAAGGSGSLWNQENLTTEHTGFTIPNHHSDQHSHHWNPTATHIQAKKRRVLQPHPHHFRSQKKPPALTIPSFTDPVRLNPSPEVSPRTLPSLPTPLLRPCHVCHRKPTTRVMLDAYADCELCGERACYICLRECNALDCDALTSTCTYDRPEDPDLLQRRRRRKICSSCAVEGLAEDTEEIVWCLNCVRREEVRDKEMRF